MRAGRPAADGPFVIVQSASNPSSVGTIPVYNMSEGRVPRPKPVIELPEKGESMVGFLFQKKFVVEPAKGAAPGGRKKYAYYEGRVNEFHEVAKKPKKKRSKPKSRSRRGAGAGGDVDEEDEESDVEEEEDYYIIGYNDGDTEEMTWDEIYECAQSVPLKWRKPTPP